MPDPNCIDCFGTGCCCGGIGHTHWSDEDCCGCVDPNIRRMTMVQLIFKPRNLWIGLHITEKEWCSKRNRWLHKIYIMPLPAFGLQIEWSSL